MESGPDDGVSPTCLDRTIHALADPTRRAILDRLSQGEVRVNLIAMWFGISLSSVSRHVHALENAGLVFRRKLDGEQFLSLAADHADRLDDLVRWIADLVGN